MSWFTFMSDKEMSALQGLSQEAKVLYAFELRRYADENCITGKVRRHSYQSFKEQLTVIPDIGSNKKPPEVTTSKIRAALTELERRGLIEKLPEPLVFRLILVERDKSVQKRNDTMNDRGTTGLNATASTVSEDSSAEERHEERHTSELNTTTTTTKDSRQKFRMTLDWQPTEVFQKRAMMQGVLPSKITPEVIGGFICHYEGQPEEKQQLNNQSQWENLLVKWIKGEWEKKPAPSQPFATHYQPKKPVIDEPRMNIPLYVPEPPKEQIVRPRTTALTDIFKN